MLEILLIITVKRILSFQNYYGNISPLIIVEIETNLSSNPSFRMKIIK